MVTIRFNHPGTPLRYRVLLPERDFFIESTIARRLGELPPEHAVAWIQAFLASENIDGGTVVEY